MSFLAVLLVGSGTNSTTAAVGQWVTPLELDFGPVGVGTTSPSMNVTITNSGTTPITGWAGGAVPAPFNASQDCNVSGGLLPGRSCHYFFTFSPTGAGSFSAVSNSSTTAGPLSVTVHGTGVGAKASYDLHALDFGDVFTSGGLAGTSPTQVVTITNTGLVPLTGWAGGAVPAPFNASQDCNIAGDVLPGHSCHYFFNFSTTATGTFSATSTSSINAGTISIDVSGKAHSVGGVGGGQLISPRSIDFGPVGIGSSAQLSVAITNNGLTNITGWAGGAVPAPFNGSQDCNIAGGLPPGATCHFFFTFSPTAAGPFSAASNASDSFGSFSIAMQGTGVGPGITANSLWLDFGPVALGSSPSQQVVTITNIGLAPLTGWAGGAVPAPFNGSQDCNIAGGILPGQSCHFFYTFSPTAEGSFAATSRFSTNAGSMNIKLQGPEPTIPITLTWGGLAVIAFARTRGARRL